MYICCSQKQQVVAASLSNFPDLPAKTNVVFRRHLTSLLMPSVPSWLLSFLPAFFKTFSV